MSYLTSRAALCLATTIALGACAQVAYKRGSGPEALAAARATCEAQNPAPAAVRSCLSQAGWGVTDMTPSLEAEGSDPSEAQPAPSVPIVEKASPPDHPASAKKLAISGWWKAEANADDLHAVGDACAAALGAENQPDAGYHLVTRAFYACLSAHGWHGLGHAAS